MKTTLCSLLLFLAVSLIFISSCSDDQILNNGNVTSNISGSVLDRDGFPVPSVRIWLNNESYTESGGDGNFSFKNVKTPYDLAMSVPFSNELTVFKGLTNFSPKLYLDNTITPIFTNQAMVFMTFPGIYPNGESRISFLTNESRYQYSQNSSLDSSAVFIVKWNGSSKIKGKVALIQYKHDIFGKIVSYDRFGFRDTALSAGETIYIKMTDSDLQFNPPENNVTFNLPGGLFIHELEVGIAFNGYNKFSNIVLMHVSGGSLPLSVVVPANLILDYQVYAYLNFTGSTYYTLAGHGGIVYVPAVTPVNLVHPETGDSADYNTDFVHDGTGNLFVTSFYSISGYPNCIVKVVSGSDSVRLPILPFFRINVIPGTQFSWNVLRYDGFAGVNEFASDKRISNSQYNVTSSQPRQFYLR